jgi:uncharacterized protein with PIN domain
VLAEQAAAPKPMSSYFNRAYSGAAQSALQDAHSAERKAEKAMTEMEFMKRDIDRLLMLCEALWTLLQRAHGYSDEDLKKVIAEMDRRDGQLDARADRKVARCPSCNRPVSARQPKCIYCGQGLEHEPFGR